MTWLLLNEYHRASTRSSESCCCLGKLPTNVAAPAGCIERLPRKHRAQLGTCTFTIFRRLVFVVDEISVNLEG